MSKLEQSLGKPYGQQTRIRNYAIGLSVALATMISAVGIAPGTAFAASDEGRAAYLGHKHYTGEFHSHTSVSDGAEMPPNAFQFVHDETPADFFAVTEHDVMYDQRNGDDFIDDWRNAASEEWRYLHEQAFAFNKTQDKLVAVPGIENTWYDGTGHINVFNTDWKATARAQVAGSIDGFGNSFGTGDLKYDMYTFFARLKQDPNAIAQFNHPSLTSKGNFFNFNGLDRTVDDRIDLIEVKSPAQLTQYQLALDTGWHLAPVYNGDEHSPNWVKAAKPTSGIWATGHTLDDLYSAMRQRSLYSTLDENTVLGFSANGKLMGSVLPAHTSSADIDITVKDPDAGTNFTSVEIIGNKGTVLHSFPGVRGADLHLTVNKKVADGDFFYVKATQAGGQFVVSAPIWVGETTRGANYAPEITITKPTPATARMGDRIALPSVTAADDSGAKPTVTFEAYDAAGEVPITDGTITIRSFSDHFVVIKAADDTGNIGSELVRITVAQDGVTADTAFRHFGSTAAVAEKPGGAGLAVSTDRSIDTVFAQVRAVGTKDWTGLPVRSSTNNRNYEVNTIGRDMPNYSDQITGQPLRSHEFDIRGLSDSVRYEYRFGATSGPAPTPEDTRAWTGVLGEFVAGGGSNEPIYLIGDLQATTHNPSDLGLLRGVLDRLQKEAPGGRTLIQTGDLVDNGGRGQYWDEVFEHVFTGLDIQVAPVAGNHETYGDPDYNALTPERTAIFSSMFNLPKNGVIGESNYSFTRGDVHVSILNSNFNLDEQLAWLRDDLRSSTSAWNVVSGHFSYYGGRHGDDPGMAADRAKVTRAFDELGVDAYIGGHDHLYKRSTIFEDRLAKTPEEEAAGTTFVTLGSAGPKFYDNAPHWWDDVVFDEDVQTGSVMEVTPAGLKISTYTLDGREVDTFTVPKSVGTWRVGSVDLGEGQLRGVGFLSSPESRGAVTVSAATYDSSEQQMRDLRTADVTLRHFGAEQFIEFDSPLPVGASDTVKVFVWDSLGQGVPLIEPLLVREGIEGSGTAAEPYLIKTLDDLQKMNYDPAGHYLLTNDLDATGTAQTQIGALKKFTGVFDGGGHTITGFEGSPSVGAGLFLDNGGTIRNLHVHATIETQRSNVGLIADVNNGTIERSWASGSITGKDGVGGLVGLSHGRVTDSYSTADVTARGRYAGGAIAIARGGSTTTQVYATGAVIAEDRNAGGVVSYGNDETLVESSVALNTEVTAPSFAHAIVGRVADGQVAILSDNFVGAAVPVGVQSVTIAPAHDNLKGATVATAEVRRQSFFEGLNWDFSSVWQWNTNGRRPTLRIAAETVAPKDPSQQPALPQSADGRYLIGTASDLAQVKAFPDEDYRLTADLDLSGSALGQLGAPAPFSGELDGDGHVISGVTSSTGGLFATMNGWVHDLGVIEANVSKTTPRAGILADQSAGKIERVYTTGTITGNQRTGGIVGDSFGVIRDSYSTAAVTGKANRYTGGIAGITEAGSLTERVYSTGSVTSTGERSIGGISGYAYLGTVLRNSVALNSAVTGTSFAHRVVSRVGGDNVSVATLENNAAIESLVPSVQSVPEVGPATLNGTTLSVDDARSPAVWADTFGWDFGAVWSWNADASRPVLQKALENVPVLPTGPALAQDADGSYLLKAAADFSEMLAWPGANYRLAADLDGAAIATLPVPFTGTLDGAGHAIENFTSTAGGLFATIDTTGQVRNLIMREAKVTKAAANAGIIADSNRGLIERVSTSGAVTATGTAGGIAGTSWAVIRDSFSTASARTTTGHYAGGIVGIAESGSTTERVFASGDVSGGSTAGGIAGYARDKTTTVRDSFALGDKVTATAFAQRVVARAASGQTATTRNNSAIETLVAEKQKQPENGADTLNGHTRTSDEARDPQVWSKQLGWDFDAVWAWDAATQRPALRTPARDNKENS